LALNVGALVPFSAGGAQLLDRQVFNSSGTWTKPTDYAGNTASGAGKFAVITCIGGGASGEAGSFGGNGKGGGPGGKTVETVAISLLSSTETVTVGAGGAASAIAGGDSSLGTWARAGGGKVATGSTNGGVGYGNTAQSIAIPGPADSIQFQTFPGQGGTGAVAGKDSLNAPGGAVSAAGTAASGNGCGGGGGGGASSTAGGAGGAPGGGGGGGGSGATTAGGAGGTGRVIVEVYG